MANNDSALIAKIADLKKRKNAVLLAHNYEPAEIQDIADFVGDSMELFRKTAATEADVIIFCGVLCMAETAAIIRPDVKIILPDLNAGCTLANMIASDRLLEKKKQHPGVMVLCHTNTPAEVKAEADICYTTDNVFKVVETISQDREVMLIADQYIGDYVATVTGREFILWPGFCSTLIKVRAEDIARQKALHPQAKVVVHMQCIPQVKALADAVAGSAGIIEFARQTDAAEIIVGTDIGIIHRLQKEVPGKVFIAGSDKAVCRTMKLITLENILFSLESLTPPVTVPEDILRRAKPAVDKMLKI